MAAPLSVLFSNGLITDAFIDVCINDGTHASLHALMLLGTGAVGLDVLNLLKRGPPGPAGGLWSVPRSQNAKRVYATHHFADYQACRAHLPRPTAILPNATANIIPWLINNCSDCFKFLVRQGVIKSYGYDNALRSYFHIACSAPMNKPLVQYMLKRLPDDELFAPQTLTLNMVPADWTRASIFWYLRNDEALFAQYITRLDWLTRRTISRASVAVLRNGGNMMQVLGHPFGHAYLAKYLNPNIAGLLADQIDPAWSINLGELIINDENNDSASLWIAVIKEKNPRRIQMLKWMAENPFTPTPAFPNGTMVNEPNYSPRVSKGWHWKATPLAAAVAFGDAVAVRELCRMPAVDLLAGCPGLNPAIMALPGAAGLMNELKEQNLPAFEMWLQYAAPLIRATAFIFPGVTRMLDHIVSKTVGGFLENEIPLKESVLAQLRLFWMLSEPYKVL
ncbi:hypothetical protein N7456_013645 [Penicillium angulare]|uniref:Uncharacterized protein n=1 Tax=Penicillium angulare TaxID=116970 RepID=A0A9W9EFV4_9EURO|nr:hypothetical protein N7456_013645 [Penicillium angulare]